EVFPDGIKLGPNGNLFVGLNSAPVVIELAPYGSKIVARHEFASQGTPNMAFSADGETMFVMAFDNEAAAPYEGRVLSVPLPCSQLQRPPQCPIGSTTRSRCS